MPEINDQIQQEKLEAQKWYAEHKSELPAVGFRGAGTDKYTEYLRRAYAKVKDSPQKLRRATFGGQDNSPESTLSALLHDAGTLEASDPQDRITNTAEYNLRQRDDASTENGLTREDVTARLVARFAESLTCYYRHVIDREKCRDIKITIYGKRGIWTLKPAIVKKWALAVQQWVLALSMPLEEKARFLGELRQAVEDERKEIAWRGSPEPEKSDKWAQLFAAVEPRRLWWERRRPQVSKAPASRWWEWMEELLPLAGKRSQRWLLIAGPILSGKMLAENPLPLSQVKTLAGGSTWRSVPTTENSHYLGSFGLIRPDDSDAVREFILSQRSKSAPVELKPLPPFSEKPAGKLEVKPEGPPKRAQVRKERKQAKLRAIEQGYLAIIDGPEPIRQRTRELLYDIVEGLKGGKKTKQIASDLSISEISVKKYIDKMKKAV